MNNSQFKNSKHTMKRNLTSLRFFAYSFVLIFAIYLSGCVNVDQKTKINQDGSGSISLEYWTKMSNLSSGDELGGFAFEEAKAKDNYTSTNSDVSSVSLEENLDDSTSHVKLEIEFKDINALNAAKGFEKVTTEWVEGDDGMAFKYVVAADTSNAKNMGASDTKLTYTFEFPDEVISTNGRKDGNKVVFEKTLADLSEDLEMTATIKSEKKGCGLFGLELPIIIFAGLAFTLSRRRKS